MPNRGSAVITGAPETPDCSNRAPTDAPDEPDQRSRGFSERLFDRIVPPTALVRFLGYVRPHLWLVAGGSVMGILKFTQPHAEHLNQMIDRWCNSLAATLHLGAGSAAKLEALTAALFALFVVQAIATYYRNYWASMAGHRLIFDLRYALYLHMQRLSHSFFDRTTSGAVVSRFISDISMAQNFVGSAMINIWM